MAANKVESIFYWYFRFNGFFIIDNFTIHKDFKKKPGGGESDILAVRFPFSYEEPRNFPFLRDEDLILTDKIDFVLAEIKTSLCEVNDATLNREFGNMQYVLKCMGFLEEKDLIEAAADSLYSHCIWQPEDSLYSVRVIACGDYENDELHEAYPQVMQITLDRAIEFLKRRFNTRCVGINRSNWSGDIQLFAKLCEKKLETSELKAWILEKPIELEEDIKVES